MNHDDDSLLNKFGLVQGGRIDHELDDLDIRPEDYRAYALDRQARPSNAMLDFWLSNGNQKAIAYTHLYDVDFDPSTGLVLTFSEHVVVVAGRNLDELYRGLKRHRVIYLWEADPPTVKLSTMGEPVITQISIQSRREVFDLGRLQPDQ